jgi:hypothetical protein
MGPRKLVEIRRQAEAAVSDMPDGELKLKAFQVILNSLLQGQERAPDTGLITSPIPLRERKQLQPNRASKPTSTVERILVFKSEGFFEKLRTIGEVREHLAVRGWHYPVTALSGPMQDLVQRRELRRQKMPEGKRRVWKYCNP